MDRNRKQSYLWNHFTIIVSDPKYVTCNTCNIRVSRGSENPKKQTISGLSSHLKTRHPQITEKNDTSPAAENSDSNSENDQQVPNKRKRPFLLFDINSKKQRNELLQSTIPGWVETSSKIDTNSEKGQKFHKSIFEMIILDLQPWSIVNDPGFLRHHAPIAPNYEIASEKYYRSMLNPAYEKFKDAMQNLLKKKKCRNSFNLS